MKVASNKIADIIKHYEKLLSDNYDLNSSNQLLRELISFYIKIPFNEVRFNLEKRISESQLLDIHFGVKRLLNNEPIQYIIGETEFLDIILKLNKHTLIPRPETEELVLLIEKTLDKNISSKLTILDIGTGSGCIAISIQKLTNANVTGIDISKEALIQAKANSILNNTKVDFKEVDILNIDDRNKLGDFDIIISNPPYVQNSEKALMQANVLDYEPSAALFVENNNPLIFYKAINDFAKDHLNKNGSIFIEINEYLSDETASIFKDDFSSTKIINDFRDKKRFCVIN